MRQNPRRRRAFAGLALVVSVLLASGCGSDDAQAISSRHTFFQTSTLGALNVGVFEGELTIGALRMRGDFGLGTFDALDGEMIVLDGQVFRVGIDGLPQIAPDDATTPFAAVTRFAADQTLTLDGPLSYSALQQELDAQLATLNVPVAVKISGELPSLRARSVPRQTPPFPPLSTAVAEQTEFLLTGVRGTLVGFRTPTYLSQVNAAGYHFHFLSDDRQAGGHVLDVTLGAVRIELQYMHDFRMLLPENAAFAAADLEPAAGAALELVQP